MGYFSNKKIAEVAEPTQTTLANSPNFVVFSSENDSGYESRGISTIQILGNNGFIGQESDANENYCFKIKEKRTGAVYTYYGTYDKNKVSETIFFVPLRARFEAGRLLSKEDSQNLILQNIKECLLKNPFLKNNFDISIGMSFNLQGDVDRNNILNISPKGSGAQYEFEFADTGISIVAKAAVHKSYYEYALAFYMVASTEDIAERMSRVSIKVKAGDNIVYERKVRGTQNPLNVNDDTYLLSPDGTGGLIAESLTFAMTSLVALLKKDTTLLSYIDIELDEYNAFVKLRNQYYELEIDAINPDGGHLIVQKRDVPSYYSDTIDYGTGKYQIALDIYTGHGQSRNEPETVISLGTYVTTLSKSYFGRPLWFDLNALLSKKVSYSPKFLTELEGECTWCDAGTMTDYRFVAKRTDGSITEAFYYSSPLFVMNGYNSTLEPVKLEDSSDGSAYIIDFDLYSLRGKKVKLKPLTTNFSRTHVKGQKQYFNFIYNFRNEKPSYICISYTLYTQMGTYIGGLVQQEYFEDKLDQVNTTLLKLDDFLPMYDNKTVGRIDVSLSYKIEDDVYMPISTPISFRILPEVLNTVNDFVFLNQLGGWDSVNFGGDTAYEFKATSDTIYKTLQNDFTLQSEIESVSSHKIKEQKIVKTSPITKEDVLWLRQMSASPAVYELSTKRYILIDDMALKHNSSDDLYQVEMKYHYTDTFNNQISK